MSKLNFEYKLVRKNVKNINCRIKNDGTVYVSANKNVSIKYIESFLLDNQDKILEALKKVKKTEETKFNNNEVVKILNQDYVLKLESSVKVRIFLENNIITLQLPDVNDFEMKEKMFNKFCLQFSKVIIEPLSKEVYLDIKQHYNIPYPLIKYKKMKSMWGSCNKTKEVITFNSNLLFTNKNFLMYVIYHEFVHLIHPNHQKGFHDTMKFFMPNYKEIKRGFYDNE